MLGDAMNNEVLALENQVATYRRYLHSAVRNVGFVARHKMPRWSAVAHVLAVSSPAAHALCAEVGLDPDEMIGGRDK